MKQRLWLIALTVGFALQATDPEPSRPIVLQSEEMDAILAHEETYAYFGGAVKSSLSQDLPAIYNASQNQGVPQDNLDKVCALIAEGKTTAPKQVLQAALEEAATSLAVAPRLTSEEIEQLANSIENYYTQLDNGTVDVHVNNTPAPEDIDETATRSTFKNRVFVGNVNIFGNNNVRGSENVSGNVTIRGNETVLSNLTVGGNVTVDGTISAANGVSPSLVGGVTLTGNPQQACIIFVDNTGTEKARLCSSPIPGDKGLFISVNGGATQNLRVNNMGSTIINPGSGSTTAGLSVNGNPLAPAIMAVGNGTSTAPALQLVGDPASLTTDFLLTIDALGNVRQSSGTATFGSLVFANTSGIINGGQAGPLTIGTTNATPLTFITSGVNRLQIDQTGNATFSGNIKLPAATPNVSTANATDLTNGLLELGGANPSASNVSFYEIGTRNLFMGNYATTPNVTLATANDNLGIGMNALQSITTGTGNVAIGPFASTALSVANNTVAIGVSANAQTATDSVVIGNSATAVGNARSIVLGSRDSTSSGTAPHTGAVNAIAIGSASGTFAGAIASGTASIAIGGSDGATGTGGASATGGGSIALGVYSQAAGLRALAIGNTISSAGTDSISIGTTSKATGNNTIAIGTDAQSTATNGSIAIGSNGTTAINGPVSSNFSAIAIGSGGSTGAGANASGNASMAIGGGNGTAQGATASGTAAIALGGSSGSGTNGATSSGTVSIAIGTSSNASGNQGIAIGAGALSSLGQSISLGNNTMSTFNNTIAIGTQAQAINANGAISIGSNGTVGGLTASTASALSAIAIGSGGSISATNIGAVASGIASIAIGGGDGTYTGATASGTRSVAIGTGASVSQNDAIILGNSTNAAVRVGIGTNAPTSRLQVAGAPGTPVATFNSGDNTAPSQIVFTNVQASGTAANGLQLSAAGSGNLQYFSSTRKIKQNIRAMRDESEVLYKLQPVVYDSKPGHGEGKDIPGFIAEEVYNVAPGLALLDQNGEPANVAYPYFHSLTVKELQKHQHTLDYQTIILNDLLNRMEKLETQSK